MKGNELIVSPTVAFWHFDKHVEAFEKACKVNFLSKDVNWYH